MPNSPHSSSASATCRIEWRPSRVLSGALIVLGLLAGLSLLASDLPSAFAWPAALITTVWGVWLARCESRREPIRLCWRGDGVLLVEDERAERAELQWRGPLAFLAWRDAAGRCRRLAGWPDTLSAACRRELRLAAMAAEAARRQARVAP